MDGGSVVVVYIIICVPLQPETLAAEQMTL